MVPSHIFILSGYIRDQTGDYIVSLYSAGATLLLTSAFFCLIIVIRHYAAKGTPSTKAEIEVVVHDEIKL